MDRVEAARELERLGDLGRGSASLPEFPFWLRRMRSGGLVAGVVWVTAVPQAVIVALGGPWAAQSALRLLIGSLIPAGYLAATGSLAPPALAPWRRRLWLCSKIAGATLASLALGAVAIAGFWGVFIAAPALAIAFGTAVGTALLHRGLILGAIPTIGVLALFGHVCMKYQFSDADDTMTIHAVAFGAFGIAGLLAILSVVAFITAPPPAWTEQDADD